MESDGQRREGSYRAKGFFHVADLPTFLNQLPTSSTVNAEKLIVHLLCGAKFNSLDDSYREHILYSHHNHKRILLSPRKEVRLPRKISFRISIFSSIRECYWNIREWTEEASLVRLAIQKKPK